MNSEKCDDFSYDFKTIKAAAGAFKVYTQSAEKI